MMLVRLQLAIEYVQVLSSVRGLPHPRRDQSSLGTML